MVAVSRTNVWLLYLIVALCCIFEGWCLSVATTLSPKVQALLKRTNVSSVQDLLKNSRRILNGQEANFDRPYMVYLKLPPNNPKKMDYKKWLCGGVIVHEEYILTSAACIEDVKHFYVVAGTNMYSPDGDAYTNACIKNGAKKAIWKCIPRNYVFDGHENDNIRWMNNDIAVVKVEEEFDFERRVKGCEYIPKPICYNNDSLKREAPDTEGSIAGWGTTERYSDWVNSRRQSDSETVHLLETDVTIMSKNLCKKRWGSRYANIIDNYMICTKDMSVALSEICQEKYVDCVDIESGSDESFRRSMDDLEPGPEFLHSAYHNVSTRRVTVDSGGFCENDHGGPLVIGKGVDSMVLGIISACLVKEKTNKCYGPFLYTSVYKNRNMINCAIYKTVGSDCNKKFRAGSTHIEVEMSWVDHPDGPSKHDIRRRMQEQLEADAVLNASISVSEPVPDVKSEANINITASTPQVAVNVSRTENFTDKVVEHSGGVLRSSP